MEEQEFNFGELFKAFRRLGLPNPQTDIMFRKALIDALSDLDTVEVKKKEDEFEFTEKEFNKQMEIINSQWAGAHNKNRATNWLITAWEKGYVHTIKKS